MDVNGVYKPTYNWGAPSWSSNLVPEIAFFSETVRPAIFDRISSQRSCTVQAVSSLWQGEGLGEDQGRCQSSTGELTVCKICEIHGRIWEIPYKSPRLVDGIQGGAPLAKLC